MELIITLFFIEAVLLTLLTYNFSTKGRREIEKRVTEVVGQRPVSIREQELKAPLHNRIIKPTLQKISLLLARVLPAEKEAELTLKIKTAGVDSKIAPRELLVIKYFAAAGGCLLLWLLGGLASKSMFQALVMGGAGLALGWLIPDFYLSKKSTARKQEIEKSLPDALDLLTVSVEAGLGFDGALSKVADKKKGVLSDEFMVALQEIKMGKPRAEALRDMSKRTDVDDLTSFTGSVILADQLGISIGNILRLQSEQIRQKRRQRAEEAAMKTPIKIIIPMVFFIFPAIFVVLLGPAAIQIVETFK